MKLLFSFALCLAVTCACASAQELRGSGSTLAADLYDAWAQRFNSTNVQLRYESVGSASGLKRVIAHEVDFAATDKPLGRSELDTSALLQLPAAVGAVVVAVNLPGIPSSQLQLDGPTLAGLYLGSIPSWNHPAIAALNPGLHLPALPVTPVMRAAGSGTAFVFAQYLSKMSPEFAAHAGAAAAKSKVVQSNRDAVQAVGTVAGALAYLDYSYALAQGLPMVSLHNRWGSLVHPSAQSIQDAMRLADWEKLVIDQKPTFAVDLTDAACPSCWPISTLTYVVLPVHGHNSERVLEFFQHALDEGDGPAQHAGYVPLPSRAKWRVKLSIRKWLEDMPRGKASASTRQPGQAAPH